MSNICWILLNEEYEASYIVMRLGQMIQNMIQMSNICWILLNEEYEASYIVMDQTGPDEPQPHSAALSLPPAELQAADDAGGGAGQHFPHLPHYVSILLNPL